MIKLLGQLPFHENHRKYLTKFTRHYIYKEDSFWNILLYQRYDPRERIRNHPVQGSRSHPASYPMGTRGFFPGCKATGAWSWPL